jgi:amino acid transporter
MAEQKLFVRKATGLVREIGPLTAVIIVMANVVGLGWQKRAFQFTGPAIVPESQYVLGLPPIAMAFILVGIVVLLTVWVFAILGAAMPRSGGGYVYISRILSPPVGFVASWMEYFSIAVSYGLIGTAVFEAILIYAQLAGLPGGFVSAIGSNEALFIGGVIIVVIFAGFAALGTRMAGRMLQVIFWIPAVITLVIYGVMLGATTPAVEAGIQTVGQASAGSVVQKALDLGMATAFTGGYWDSVNVAVLGAYWAYIGFAASTFVAGEIKEATRTLPRTLFMANGIIVLLYITMSLLGYRVASLAGRTPDGNFSFFSAYAYLSYSGCDGCTAALGSLPRAWTPNMAGFAAIGMGLSALVFLIPLFAALWVANDIPPFILTSSRILFAMAFDRVLPERLAAVNERWHSPTNAVIVTMLVAFVGNAAEADIFPKYLGGDNILSKYINSGGGVVATDIWDTIFFLLASLAGLFFIYRRREIYEASAYKPKIGGMPAIVVVGLLATLANVWLMWAEFQAYGTAALEPWIFTLFLIVTGAIVYGWYKSRGSRVGVDYSTIYAQIPPE